MPGLSSTGGLQKHTELKDKEIAGIIDHAVGSVTPAILSFGSWDKIAEINVTADTTSITINNLDGDVDELYLIIAFLRNPTGSNARILLRYNNDSGLNYPRETLCAWETTITGKSDTLDGAYFAYMDTGAQGLNHALLYAKSGYKRHLIVYHGRDGGGAPAAEIMWSNWTNTTDNITSIVVVSTVADAIAAGSRIFLFKLSK